MPFNTVEFIFFFIVFAFCFYALKRKYRSRFLLLGNLVFFASFNLLSLVSVLYVSIIAYLCLRLLSHRINTLVYKQKILVICGVLLAIPFLVYKVFGSHFSLIASEMIQKDYFSPYLHPVGISFYTLQVLGLLIDRFRGRSENKNLFSVISFTSFFPQSMAGPIHRGNILMPQLENHVVYKSENILIGTKILLWGFVCKLLVADKLAMVINPIFNELGAYSWSAILYGTILFSVQIYFDFYGYTEIARGLAKILGYDLAINFNSPYRARSFTEFWHRWHISLSSWFRDYVYIPLGGSKQGYWRYVLAIVVTFIISGLWHGTSYNFILWGLLHAFFVLIEERLSKWKVIKKLKTIRTLQMLKVLLFYLLLCFTWLVFKITDTTVLFQTIQKIVLIENSGVGILNSLNFSSIFILTIAGVIVRLNGYVRFTRLLSSDIDNNNDFVANSFYLLISLVTIVLFGDLGVQQFLYFKF